MTARVREAVGAAIGHVLSPAIASISRARRARMFHPEGQTLVARVDPVAPSSRGLGDLGRRLEGMALARFSGALWKRGFEHVEVLGVALRFRATSDVTPESRPTDQDLLFATIVSPFTMPLSPFTTDASDYLRNHYWAVSPFDVPQVGHVKFRLSPAAGPPSEGSSRAARLADAVATRRGRLRLEARCTFSLRWTTIADVTLERVADVDQAALRFSAFQCGRDIRPRGLVHAIRRPAYAASQRARPSQEGVGA